MKFNTIIFFVIIFASCSDRMKSGEQLSAADLKYIRGLGLLDKEEKIILFDSQGGFNALESAGNFYTDKRVAAYWVDKYDKNKTTIRFAYYNEIDSVKVRDLVNVPTYCSYMEIYKNDGDTFRVYVDEDSSGTWNFFNSVTEEWNKKKKMLR